MRRATGRVIPQKSNVIIAARWVPNEHLITEIAG